MLFPPVPENESIRLKALMGLNILDTEPNDKIEIITKFASYFIGAPICLVSLVDENRQWFKSCHGLDVKETPRYMSFCAHAICETSALNHDSRFFEICDAQTDIRFKNNPLVKQDPKIRFYIGYVLQSETKLNLGTLCIIDTKPRKFTDGERDLLKALGTMVQNILNGHSYFPDY
ncbi:MAG: GAF domain-containing protein [Pseudomonadota bacterium]